jgi:hypothetical protein
VREVGDRYARSRARPRITRLGRAGMRSMSWLIILCSAIADEVRVAEAVALQSALHVARYFRVVLPFEPRRGQPWQYHVFRAYSSRTR